MNAWIKSREEATVMVSYTPSKSKSQKRPDRKFKTLGAVLGIDDKGKLAGLAKEERQAADDLAGAFASGAPVDWSQFENVI